MRNVKGSLAVSELEEEHVKSVCGTHSKVSL